MINSCPGFREVISLNPEMNQSSEGSFKYSEAREEKLSPG
jgi:hypothetical protein